MPESEVAIRRWLPTTSRSVIWSEERKFWVLQSVWESTDTETLPEEDEVM